MTSTGRHPTEPGASAPADLVPAPAAPGTAEAAGLPAPGTGSVSAGAAVDLGLALAPLAARYGHWLGLDASQVIEDRDEDPEQIRALQLILRLERDVHPSWHIALSLAASGCARLCLDPRAQPGGEWFDAIQAYCRGHIRKVTRRARGAPWEATADLPGLTLVQGDTQVRMLLPGLATELDKRVARLQVGGTDLPVDDPSDAHLPAAHLSAARLPADGPPNDTSPPDSLAMHGPGVEPTVHEESGPLLVLGIREDLPATAGKLMAQTGHAGMIAAALLAATDRASLASWYEQGCPARVVRLTPADYQRELRPLADPHAAWRDHQVLAVRDAGFTEVEPGTVTVVARLVTE